MSVTARGKLGVVCMEWYVVHSSLRLSPKPIFPTRFRFCLLWDTSPLLPQTGVTVNTCTSAETNWNGEKFRCETRVTRLFKAIDSRCYDFFFFCMSPSSPVSHTQLQHSRKHREQMVYMREKKHQRGMENERKGGKGSWSPEFPVKLWRWNAYVCRQKINRL